MSITVFIPSQLRALAGGAAQVEVAGSSVAEVLMELDRRHPGIGIRILDEQKALRRFVNVFVGDEDVRFLEGLATTLRPGDSLSIIPAVAGG